jgi:peroxiredoxin
MATPRLKLLTLLLSVGFLSCVSSELFAQKDVHAILTAPANRKTAPMFHLVSDKGKAIQVSNYRGHVVLLNFWATACGGCILEIPSFVELQKAYGNRGFTAVGIATDVAYEGLKNADEAWRRVRPFMADHQINYPILMADDSVINSYGFKSYPATYLIDKSGRIAATYVGIVDKNDVDTNVKALLSER